MSHSQINDVRMCAMQGAYWDICVSFVIFFPFIILISIMLITHLRDVRYEINKTIGKAVMFLKC